MNKKENTVADLTKKTVKTDNGQPKVKAKVDRKPESKKDEQKPVVIPEKKEPTIEEKLNKLNDLNALVEKRNRLNESRNKLNSFDLKRENHSTEIVLSDGSGNRFQTINTQAVDQFIDSTKMVLEIELAKVEALIQF